MTYLYKCRKCKLITERDFRMGEAPPYVACEHCLEKDLVYAARRVWTPAPAIFKWRKP